MFGLPQSTVLGKHLPKNQFYKQLPVTAEIKQLFVDEIENINWRHKLSPDKLNVDPGTQVDEIQVIEIRLRMATLDKRLLEVIYKGIPSHVVFAFSHGDRVCFCVGYKEHSGTTRALQYYQTEWQPAEQATLAIVGLNMDAIYEHLVRQIAGERLYPAKSQPLKQVIERQQQREKLNKRIVALENKRDKEKQFNRQVEMNAEIRALQRELEEL